MQQQMAVCTCDMTARGTYSPVDNGAGAKCTTALTYVNQRAKIPDMTPSGRDNSVQSSSGSTLVGYINGPKSGQPQGVRVIEPPPGTRQHQRGNLYIIVELFGNTPKHETLANRMLGVLQRAYYTARGSQAEVMATGIEAAHKLLQEHNREEQDAPLAAGMLCAALLNGRLLIATSGSTFALVRSGESVHMFPSEVEENGAVGAVPERIEVFRQDVGPDDVFFVGGGSWLHDVPLRTLAGIVAYTSAETCHAAADELYDRSGASQYPGLIVVLEGDEPPTDDDEDSPGGPPGYGRSPGNSDGPPPRGSGNATQLRSRRPRAGGLPTALGASPVNPSTMGWARAPGEATGGESSAGPEPPPGRAETATARAGRDAGWPPSAAPFPDAPFAAESPDEVSEPYDTEPYETGAYETGATPIDEADLDRPGRSERTDASLASRSRQFSVGAGSSLAGMWQGLRSFFARMLPDGGGQRPRDSATEALNEDGEDADYAAAETVDPIYDRAAAGAQRAGEGGFEDDGFDADSYDEDAEADDAYARRAATAPTTQGRPTTGTGEASAPELVEDSAPAGFMPVGTDPAQIAPARVRATLPHESPPPLPELEPFTAPAPAKGARARLFILLAVMIVVLAPAVVGGIYLSEAPSRRAEADALTSGAAELLANAQAALDLEDRVLGRRQLNEAQDLLNQAVEMDDWTDRRRTLASQIQAELDEVAQRLPLYGLTAPILEFGAGADPRRIVVVNDEIYILDAGREAVYRYRFDPAVGQVLSPEGQVILRQGDVVGDVVVGTLHDISWLPLTAGQEDKPSLLILDRQNNVFRFDQRVEGVTRLIFGDQAEWGSIGQIETYGGRVYVADEATGQLYRYSAGLYNVPGEPWFAPETLTSLAGLRDMEIDGDIWFLYESGMVLRYRDRQQVPFSLESSIGFTENPSDFYVAREGQALLYVVDPNQARILVYNKQGEYQHQLVAPEGDPLRGVSALDVDEIAGRMFILTPSGLYLHPLVE